MHDLGGADLFSHAIIILDRQHIFYRMHPRYDKEQMTLGLERVYEIANFYRAENSHTGRHLTEFASVDHRGSFNYRWQDLTITVFSPAYIDTNQIVNFKSKTYALHCNDD